MSILVPTCRETECNQVVIPAENCGVDDVFTMFSGMLKPKQIMCAYRLCDDSFDATVECLLEGPTLDSLLKTLNRKYTRMPVTKLYLDQDDMRSYTVAFYKSLAVHYKIKFALSSITSLPLILGGFVTMFSRKCLASLLTTSPSSFLMVCLTTFDLGIVQNPAVLVCSRFWGK